MDHHFAPAAANGDFAHLPDAGLGLDGPLPSPTSMVLPSAGMSETTRLRAVKSRLEGTLEAMTWPSPSRTTRRPERAMSSLPREAESRSNSMATASYVGDAPSLGTWTS